MKRHFSLIITLIVFAINANCQPGKFPAPEVQQRMKVEKITFIANQLELTPQEAQNFWPVYNEYEQKKFKIEKEKHILEIKSKSPQDTIPLKEFQELCMKYVSLAEQETAMLETYNKQLLKILPADKVLKLYFSERKFRSHMLQEYRRRGPRE